MRPRKTKPLVLTPEKTLLTPGSRPIPTTLTLEPIGQLVFLDRHMKHGINEQTQTDRPEKTTTHNHRFAERFNTQLIYGQIFSSLHSSP